jgi:hypothetical protein
VSAAKQIVHRPGTASALGLRAGSDGLSMISQTDLAENRAVYTTPLARILRRLDYVLS